NYVLGKDYTNNGAFSVTNDLPITTIASDKVTFPIDAPGLAGDPSGLSTINSQLSTVPEWQRWNDYGIGLLLEGNRGAEKGELIQAAAAFSEVEKLGRADGPLNLARVYFKEGRLDDAVLALQRANKFDPPAPHWTVAWFN